MRQAARIRLPLKVAVPVGLAALAAGCADSTIHKIADVGDVKTLSLDAKQRLVFVANRSGGHHGSNERVTCTEPMPEAIVAKAAVLAASGKFEETGGPSASGSLSGGQAETAGSIGYRDHTIQMLRDGYYRLCEAYMNGAIDKAQYSSMIRNADTFMVTISALQVIGSNQIAPAITLQPNVMTASTKTDGTSEIKTEAGKNEIRPGAAGSPANAQMAYSIMSTYLNFRGKLARFEADMAMRRHRYGTHDYKSK